MKQFMALGVATLFAFTFNVADVDAQFGCNSAAPATYSNCGGCVQSNACCQTNSRRPLFSRWNSRRNCRTSYVVSTCNTGCGQAAYASTAPVANCGCGTVAPMAYTSTVSGNCCGQRSTRVLSRRCGSRRNNCGCCTQSCVQPSCCGGCTTGCNGCGAASFQGTIIDGGVVEPEVATPPTPDDT